MTDFEVLSCSPAAVKPPRDGQERLDVEQVVVTHAPTPLFLTQQTIANCSLKQNLLFGIFRAEIEGAAPLPNLE